VVAHNRVAGVDEDAEHQQVVREHVCFEGRDAPSPLGGGQVREEQRAHPVALHGVLDQEGHLGSPRLDVLGRRHADDRALQLQYQRSVADIGGRAQPVRVGVGLVASGGEEAPVQALV
jgi:hypothetical protein